MRWIWRVRPLVQTRITEGEHLKNDLIDKLDNMLELVTRIEKRSPLVVDEYRVRLEDKVSELLSRYIH